MMMKTSHFLPAMILLFVISLKIDAKANTTIGSGDASGDKFKNIFKSRKNKKQTGNSFIQEAPENKEMMREVPSYYFQTEKSAQKADTTPFKPSISVGSIVHMFASTQQAGYMGSTITPENDEWDKGFSLYRARVLVGGQLSKKGSFFMETEIPSVIGTRLSNTTKNVKVSPIILDAQYEHKFAEAFQVVVGKQLVSSNRNGLQGAAGLMANDFTYFQYPYNLFEDSPLQGNFGRDLGVNTRGFFLNDKLEYRLGFFTGRRFNNKAPLRTVGRLVYNFLDPDKAYYYSGTMLGTGKTISLGAGFDAQATYSNIGADLFVDVPVGPGSVTLNSAFQYMTGGTDLNTTYTFAPLIPKQTVQFLELGYYFKEVKLQPWIRYENQNINAETEQTGGVAIDTFDKLNSGTVFGGGLNYFFNGYGTNLRLSYTSFSKNAVDVSTGNIAKKAYGQIWLQLQFFIF